MKFKNTLSPKAGFSFNGVSYKANDYVVNTQGDKELEKFLSENPFWEEHKEVKEEVKEDKKFFDRN